MALWVNFVAETVVYNVISWERNSIRVGSSLTQEPPLFKNKKKGTYIPNIALSMQKLQQPWGDLIFVRC